MGVLIMSGIKTMKRPVRDRPFFCSRRRRSVRDRSVIVPE
jgi:hypothetical protein